MNEREYDALVFIGRFQPFHNGHVKVVKKALKKAQTVVIVVGSANQPPSLRNPFSASRRIAMICDVFPKAVDAGRIFFVEQEDRTYMEDKWVADVVKNVENALDCREVARNKIGLIGHGKDASSYYLTAFPMWGKSVSVEDEDGISATPIREEMYTALTISDDVPEILHNGLKEWCLTEKGRYVLREYIDMLRYKAQFSSLLFPPTFNTADAVVVQSGRVLLIQRKSDTGDGLWAIPGGFLNQEETLKDAALRELQEETGIKVPYKVLNGSIKQSKVFDDPLRSARGRVITNAFLINLPPQATFPKVSAADDAQDVKWVPFHEVKRVEMFEDHYDIIDYFVGLY